MKIRINKNPAGYSAGTYEYVIVSDNGAIWFNGGYHSSDDAKKAAKKHLRRTKGESGVGGGERQQNS